MTVTLTSSITGERVELEIDFRPLPVLPTGTIAIRRTSLGSIIRTIEWVPNAAVAAVLRKAGKKVPAKLEGGYVYHNDQVGNFVEFGSFNLKVRTADKPDLAELWQWESDALEAEQQARNRYWRAESREQKAVVINSVPDGSVLVRKIGSAPDPWEAGMSIGVWQSDDGRTFAGSPTTQAEGVGYLADADLTKYAAAYAESERVDAERKQQQAEAIAHRESELKTAVVPPAALAAYRLYKGDDEKAWAAEDESAWAEIRQYRDAIEAQGLAYPSADVIRRDYAPEEMQD